MKEALALIPVYLRNFSIVIGITGIFLFAAFTLTPTSSFFLLNSIPLLAIAAIRKWRLLVELLITEGIMTTFSFNACSVTFRGKCVDEEGILTFVSVFIFVGIVVAAIEALAKFTRPSATKRWIELFLGVTVTSLVYALFPHTTVCFRSGQCNIGVVNVGSVLVLSFVLAVVATFFIEYAWSQKRQEEQRTQG